MSEILSCAGSVASQCLVCPVGPHCGYVFFTDRKVRQLEGELEELVHTREMVGQDVEEARNNLKPIFPGVEKWLENEQIVANKARSVLDGRAQKTCFCGWLPNPKARYCLGKDASKTVEEIQKLIVWRNRWENVYYENAPAGCVPVAPEGYSSAGGGGDIITGSRASIFQYIMEALGDDKLKVIGVYGPGGVGKTILLKKVKEILGNAGGPFHKIVMAEVTQTPDYDNIRNVIAADLGLDLGQEQSPQGRRDLLLERLQRDPSEKILIILDGLWKELDLEAVGIPNGDESGGCKLLLTSRYKDVLEQEMHADRTFRLVGLNIDEAFRLFEKTVGNRLKDEEELKQIAAEVVKELAGLPLLIISVASTLKYSDAPAWRNALIKIDESNIETIVRLSYDHLKSEDAKSLFLLCGLIGGTIRVEFLLVLSMGLGLFEGFHKTMEDARDKLNTMLDELRSACLLLDGGDDKNKVTIHDLYSKVVVSTPFRGQNSLIMNNNSWSEEKLEKCWAISLMDVGSDRLAELMRCRSPDLKILMLSQPGDWDGSPAHRRDEGYWCRLDFTHMKQLRVLYLRSMHIPNLPSSIKILENLRLLYLDHCDVEDVSILGKLKPLQILSFSGSTISKLPKEIGDLINLKSLNLSNCNKLAIIEPGVLEGLINLEELLMRDSFDQWIGNDEVSSESCSVKLAELKSLRKLSALEISIPDPIILLEAGDLPFGNLTRFWINIGGVFGREFESLRTMKLKIEGCDSILSKEWVQKILHKTQYLHLDGLGESKENAHTLCNAHELCTQGFPQLKHLVIRNSPSIEYIASSSGGIPLTAFTRLESLILINLINLEKICHDPIAPECLSKLKAVSIRKCDRLNYLWCLSQMQRFVHLEEIVVGVCESMRAIVIDDAREDIVGHDIVELPNVCRLNLGYLPKMTSFCIEAGTTLEGAPIQVSFPRSEGVFVKMCPSLESLFYCGSLDSNTEHVLLPKSEVLTVDGSEKLRHVVKSDSQMVLDFPRLTNVNCEQMKEVVPKEESSQSKGVVMSFPSLTDITILGCRNFRAFNSSPTRVDRKSDKTTEENDESPQPLFNEMVKLPNIRSLRIEGAQCKELWNDQIPNDSFCKLEFLELWNCDNLQRVAPSHMWKRLHRSINILQVESCRSIKIMYEGDDTVMKSGKLRRLVLRDLQNLRHIWHSDGLPNVPFPNLRFIEVQSCPRLRMLFPTFTPEFLGQIKELVVESCEDMKLIAGHEEFEEATGTTITFSELIAVRLFELPKFRSFLPEKYSVEFPSLQVLSIVSCGTEPDIDRGDWGSYKRCRESEISQETRNYKFIFNPKSLEIEELFDLEKILYSQPPSQYINLKSVLIRDFASSASSIPLDWILKLPNLESLEIKSCQSTKVVFEQEDLKVMGHVKILSRLMELTLWKLPNLQHLWKHDVKLRVSVFPNLKELNVRETGLAFLFPVSVAKCLREIRCITVFDCRNMEAVIVDEGARDGGTDDIIEFPKLKRLCISKCPMKKFFSCHSGREELVTTTSDSWDAYSDSFFDRKVAFPRLETVEISGLDNLGFMIFPSMVKSLARLRKLRVIDCMKMEAIITEEEGWEIEASETLKFPMLTDLHLQHLQSLKCFSRAKRSREAWSEDRFKSPSTALFSREVVFPSLEALHISSMGYIKMIWDNHSTRFFQHLKTLDVSYCDELSNMFTPIIAENLVELTKLTINNCKMLTRVINNEGSEERPVVAFKQLKYMELKELIELTCFSSGRYTLMFPLLEDIIVTGCLNMKFFSEAPIRAPKLKRVEGLIGTWFWNGNIRHPMQNTSIEMATGDGVEFMHLSGSSGLTGKWHNKLLPIKSYCQVKSLAVDNCPSFLSAIPSGLMFVLDKTNALQVQDCEPLEEVFNLEGLEVTKSTQMLPQLWCLNLVNLPKLRRLWDKDNQGALRFHSLSYLTLYKCSNLKHAFAPSMTRCLPALQWMEIKDCDQMEGVIAEEKVESNAVEKITFQNLRWMEMERLPRLASFLSGTNHIVEFPILKELTITHCPKIVMSTWQSCMKIDQRISLPFPPQVLFPRVKTMVLSNMDHSSKIGVHASQRSWKVEVLEKLQAEFCVIEETDPPSAT